MKKIKIVLSQLMIALITSNIIYADLIEIPLKLDNWTKIQSSEIQSSEVEETSEGLKASKNGWLGVCGIKSKTYFNFSDSETFIKFKVITTDHVTVDPGIYIVGKNILNAWRLTTNYSNSGSTVIYSDTWYYLRIRVNPDKTFTVTTSKDNYDTLGGTVIKKQTGSIPDTENLSGLQVTEWGYISKTFIGIWLNSSSNTSGYIIAGEAKTTAVPYSNDGNCILNDSDNDGVIDQWDSCPQTAINSAIYSNGCIADKLYSQIEDLTQQIHQKSQAIEQKNEIIVNLNSSLHEKNQEISDLNTKINSMFSMEQMEKMVNNILSWGDTDNDGKIGLKEAIKALMVTSGINEN